MLNPIFWKKVQGQKHPGSWGIVEHQIPCIKVLFKMSKVTRIIIIGIKLLSPESKTQVVNQMYFSTVAVLQYIKQATNH